MDGGIRAQLAVYSPSDCPVVAAAETADTRATDISWTRTAGDTAVVEDFRVPADEAGELPPGASPVFEIGDRRIFRLERQHCDACACERIESLGVPVEEVSAAGGRLLLTIHLPEIDALRDIVERLGEIADRVEVTYLVHDQAPNEADLPVIIDRGRLTDRQREVLRTAFEMGFFEHPRDANAATVADELGITTATFTEHLAVAQSKLLESALSP